MLEFDWTTFILEILNFLVLVWILQRLFYRPILARLDARQQKINADIEHAAQLSTAAEALRQQYASQLLDWEQQKENSRLQLQAELAELRNTALDNLKQTLSDEETRLHSRNEALMTSRVSALTRKATETAYQQVSQLLRRIASKELTQRVLGVFLEDFCNLAEMEREALHKAAALALANQTSIKISSAHELDAEDRNAISETLSREINVNLEVVFTQDPDLIAGIRVLIGDCVLHTNLADELAFFRQHAAHD